VPRKSITYYLIKAAIKRLLAVGAQLQWLWVSFTRSINSNQCVSVPPKASNPTKICEHPPGQDCLPLLPFIASGSS